MRGHAAVIRAAVGVDVPHGHRHNRGRFSGGCSMLRALSLFVIFTLSAPVTLGGEPELPAALRAVQGNWKPASLKYEEADTMPADMLRQVTGVYDGNEFHLYYVDRASGTPRPIKLIVAKVTMDLDTKFMAFECDRGALKGHKLHGFYAFDGGTLKLCYGPADKPRPTTFAAPKGSGCFTEVWLRQVK
jgi:uncharacterized protein (TIGR03067 family)